MQLWMEWWKVVLCLRPACSRARSFMWLVVALTGFSVRSDLLGVTSIVRGLGLKGHYYDSLIRFFHSTAIDPDRLAQLWVKIALRVFPSVFRFNGRLVLLGDGIKVSKSGRKMPGVKCLHQESDSNTKPEYIMGHSCQAISLVVGAGSSQMITTASPVYGEVGVNIQYRCVDLTWKPLARLVRFVLVIHPTRGQCILICTDLTLPPIDIIRLYGIRFKIELAFKQSLRVVLSIPHIYPSHNPHLTFIKTTMPSLILDFMKAVSVGVAAQTSCRPS